MGRVDQPALTLTCNKKTPPDGGVFLSLKDNLYGVCITCHASGSPQGVSVLSVLIFSAFSAFSALNTDC
jgi:hypothetical protein